MKRLTILLLTVYATQAEARKRPWDDGSAPPVESADAQTTLDLPGLPDIEIVDPNARDEAQKRQALGEAMLLLDLSDFDDAPGALAQTADEPMLKTIKSTPTQTVAPKRSNTTSTLAVAEKQPERSRATTPVAVEPKAESRIASKAEAKEAQASASPAKEEEVVAPTERPAGLDAMLASLPIPQASKSSPIIDEPEARGSATADASSDREDTGTIETSTVAGPSTADIIARYNEATSDDGAKKKIKK